MNIKQKYFSVYFFNVFYKWLKFIFRAWSYVCMKKFFLSGICWREEVKYLWDFLSNWFYWIAWCTFWLGFPYTFWDILVSYKVEWLNFTLIRFFHEPQKTDKGKVNWNINLISDCSRTFKNQTNNKLHCPAPLFNKR